MALRRHLLDLLRSFRSSLLFMPVLMTLAALVLFATTSVVDTRIGQAGQPLPGALGFLVFAGSASAARTLLGAIAGTWATIAGVVYSVTLVTIQLSATKYSAQVIPTFERDRFNQVVLGAFTGTFAYALLVLKTVRAEPDPFVPVVGVNLATLLAIVSLFLFVAFVGNLTAYIRPTRFVDDLARSGEAAVRALRPEAPFLPLAAAPPARATRTVTSEEPEYFGGLDWASLDRALGRMAAPPGRIDVAVPAGTRLERADPVLHLAAGSADEEDTERLRSALHLTSLPGAEPDAFYVAETLADIAVTAMSGGSTDTGVASACSAGLARLAVADLEAGPLPAAWAWERDGRRVVVGVPPRRAYEATLEALHRILAKAAGESYGTVAEACAKSLARIHRAARGADARAADRVEVAAARWERSAARLPSPWRERVEDNLPGATSI